ncbi:MAG: metal-dependent transcriptional regulator [Saprospiraceae bacterium]|nr:metal-dependent transcriptional regulator [Saprospiraceae bacterium]MBK6564340.1 metal-dependent transcriptional regulator [Saprospiraceae bacterium]MBK7523978.1 metal-dependent transcriptional regulator [Saprospiraceae bacterium]MBK8079054.1 metal-dependent transcriptional regulator [Saprospiraceae bacterium]MBK8372030.1 metal-dependent transcriptional regulator [Saprospiraceae bacterium]
MYTTSEEDHLKAIFKIAEKEKKAVSTNSIAAFLNTAPASVTDMIKKLSEKELILYQKYKGVTLSPIGSKIAIQLIRKHRLWEVFLAEKLGFPWESVHELAEKLEHVDSDELINKLEEFLNFPKYDPHGDPIPNVDGKFTLRTQWSIAEFLPGQTGVLIGVKEHDKNFLLYLNDMQIKLGSQIKVLHKNNYDQSLRVLIEGRFENLITKNVAQQLLVKKA